MQLDFGVWQKVMRAKRVRARVAEAGDHAALVNWEGVRCARRKLFTATVQNRCNETGLAFGEWRSAVSHRAIATQCLCISYSSQDVSLNFRTFERQFEPAAI